MIQLPVRTLRSDAAGVAGYAGAAAWTRHADLQRSLHCLEQALARDPNRVDLMFQRACTLQSLGCDDRTQSAYLGILERDPTHLGSLVNLGRHFASHRKHDAARIVFTHALAHHPQNADCHLHLGLIHYEAKEFAQARQCLDTALRLAPDHQLANVAISFVLQEAGDFEGAAAHRRRGLRNRSILPLPYYGTDAPVPVIKLSSAGTGNVPLQRLLDDRTFQTWIVVPEFYDSAQPLPPHHLVINAIGDADAAPVALEAARTLLAFTTAPVVNAPAAVAKTGRCANWERLGQIPGVVTPRACTLAREDLAAHDIESILASRGLEFPILLRSPGYHTGEHFVQVDTRQALTAELAALPGNELIAMQFLDLREADGKVRKYRVMIVDGKLYPLHAAISRHWKVHYFSADMAESDAHRREDAQFLQDMGSVLGQPAVQALHRIAEHLGLDYAGIDFSLNTAGEVVVFEANATMIVPVPDPDPRWDYRRAAVERIDSAMREMLLRRATQPAPSPAAPRTAEWATAPHAALSGNALNFSAGPGALPEDVLRQAQEAIFALPETGLSVLGMSHRSAWFEGLLEEAHRNARELLAVPPSHRIVFLQGGSSLQFSMIPMNFAPVGGPNPAYIQSGYWSAKAFEEANFARKLHEAWNGAGDGYRSLPATGDLTFDPAAPYLHYVSNETVEGLQFKRAPHAGVALIADMSSDLFSRPVDFREHAMVYAHAQKNLGPAGVTMCVIQEDLLEGAPDGLPPMLDYRTHVRCGSNYNTPPVFGIYVLTLVTRWLRDRVGGIEQIERRNESKAQRLYATLDRLGELVQLHARQPFRSAMNASFRFREQRLDEHFLNEAGRAGFTGLEGHRSIGGIRVSLYNAVPEAAVTQLCEFITWFASRYG
ncbi:MAG: 3-phosphoserine/phosphohydroxythreonine transaminase [Burkholderiaceae bacterium]|nr:3-phosphoserine/phosphohydroxythreonine transaminase [Burkholderiaceae bacterium]